jgi:hypothetical protein
MDSAVTSRLPGFGDRDELRMSAHRWSDAAIACGIGLASLILYARTTAPSVVAIFDDSLEFQVVLPTLGIAHPTGYPLYTLLGHLFTRLPWREPAYAVNLFSALAAAAAVAFLYLAAHELSGQRWAALLAAAQFAVIPVWWSQATVAEVYALHGLLQAAALWLALRWSHERGKLWPLGGALGLGLAHHRMTVLLLPALALWGASRASRREGRAWLAAAGAALAPLLLYAYLPLRGRFVSSLDGAYRNDWAGFWRWVTARDYSIFFADNPLAIARGPRDYYELIAGQVGLWALVLALLGVIVLLFWRAGDDRRQRRWDGLCLATALAMTYGFALAYRVSDSEVFFIPAFLCTSLALSAGLAALPALCRTAGRVLFGEGQGSSPRACDCVLPLLLMLAGFALLAGPTIARFPSLDRSQHWEVHDLGVDWLSQPLPQGSVLIGILGETTLARYFQFAHGLRRDLQLEAADAEAERLAAVARRLAEGRAVFLTRPLPGVEGQYVLGAVGPLIRVWPPDRVEWEALPNRTDQDVGAGIHLIGYLVEVQASRMGRRVRLTVHWQAGQPLTERLKVSARLAVPGNDKLVASDSEPVHNAYPTTAWRPGIVVQDVYDLSVPSTIAAGHYELVLIVYRSGDEAELGRATLGGVELSAP